MKASHTFTWKSSSNLWILSLEHFPQLYDGAFVASKSSGELLLYSLSTKGEPLGTVKAHHSTINAISKVDEHSLATAASGCIKIWDLRQKLSHAVLSLSSSKNPCFLSLASKDNHVLAAGTELSGTDAEINLWDLRNSDRITRSFVDSHHDDVTALKFHPTLPYLMSGSTDGCVNIYNLNEPDEDEALHQVINFASVHLCHFVQPHRIGILSHMETLGFWDLNNTDYEVNSEAAPKDLGDVRSFWPDCEYVVDLYADYIVYGANSKLALSLMPFDSVKETFSINDSVIFPDAHGKEVVRHFCILPETNAALTCGEDGLIKSWKLPLSFGVSTSGVFEVFEMDINESEVKVDKKRKHREQKENKDKKKERKEKKEKKSKKDRLYKPY